MITFKSITGAAVLDVLPAVARLRIDVFKEWPYLYAGDLEYETNYLKAYRKPGALVVAAMDGAKIIGVSTGALMEDHADEFRSALDGRFEPKDVYYFAESVLKKEYRGQGIGHCFFEEREKHAAIHNRKQILFCRVLRSETHSSIPSHYRPLDPFWRKRGYAPIDGMTAKFKWRDVDQAKPTEKTLQFWGKAL